METTLLAAAVALFLWAACTDVMVRRIPNRIVAALGILGLSRIGSELLVGGPVDGALADIGLAGAVLVLGAILHHCRLLGGGDVKLVAASVLWLGAEGAWSFIASVAICGGVLAALFLIWIRVRSPALRPTLPYGVAIALGGILGSFTMN